MKKFLKKGFTIVELVIVIAVIAILTAVLIPTISSVVRKAQVSADTQLVRNLNTALTSHYATGEKPATMHEVVTAVAEDGYDLTKIKESAKENSILWDSENNVFCYLKDGKIEYIPNSITGTALKAKDYRLWIISDKVNDDYSTYYVGSDKQFTGNNAITKGFDVGNINDIIEIEYVNKTANEQKVVIRTNGGKLTIDASSDTVWHYGEAASAEIVSVDLLNSYHLCGTVGYVEIAKGHFVAESGAKVITLVNTGAKADVKLDVAEKAVIKQAITTNEEAAQQSGNLTLTYQVLTEAEKNQIIYHAEAEVINAVLVDGVYYKSIADAFDKAPKANGNGFDLSGAKSITLLRDLEGGGLFVPDKNNGGSITIDFNGFTYTVTGGVGSSGTPTQAMHFGSTTGTGDNIIITLKNGTINVKENSGIKMGLQNYARLTFEDMVIDITNVPTEFYGNTYTGTNAKYNGLEIPLFNNNYENGRSSMALINCTVQCPSTSTTGVYFEGTQNIITNCTIEGPVSVSSDGVKGQVVITGSSITKNVKSYFVADELQTSVSGNSTTYSIK